MNFDILFILFVFTFFLYTIGVFIVGIIFFLNTVPKKYNLKDSKKFTLVLKFVKDEKFYIMDQEELYKFIKFYLEGNFDRKIIIFNDLIINKQNLIYVNIISHRTKQNVDIKQFLIDYSD